MTRTVHESWRRATIVLAGCACFIGLLLFVGGSLLPPFSNESEALAAFVEWCDLEGKVVPAKEEAYFSLHTWRYPLMNAGQGLFLGGLTGLLLATLSNGASPERPKVRTPTRRWVFLAVGMAVVGGTWLTMMASLIIDQQRMLFPTCADSIIIPMFGITVLMLVASLILVVVGALITRSFGILPVPLIQWDKARPVRSWCVTIIFGAVIIVLLIVGASQLIHSISIGTPVLVVGIYLLAATRAALLAPRHEEAALARGSETARATTGLL